MYFSRHLWEREAGVLRGVFEEPPITADRLFSALSVATSLPELQREATFCLWVDNKRILTIREYLPDSLDSSLSTYLNRIGQFVKGADFTLLLANPHLYDSAFWSAARRLVRPLFAELGIPCGGVDTSMFIGRYRKTPFGVHRGQMSVMTFPVLGNKSFRLWRNGYGDEHPEIRGQLHYRKYLPDSVRLTGSPADVLYWPADYWHIGEGSDSYIASWNIGFWWDRPAMNRVLNEMSQRLAQRLNGRNQSVGSTFSQGQRIGAEVNSAIELTSALTTARGVLCADELDAALAIDHLSLVSADGFREVPAKSPSRFIHSTRTRLRTESNSTIVYCRVLQRLCIAANGHTMFAEDRPTTRAFLDTLTQGITVEVSRHREMFAIMSFLIGVNAVRILDE